MQEACWHPRRCRRCSARHDTRLAMVRLPALNGIDVALCCAVKALLAATDGHVIVCGELGASSGCATGTGGRRAHDDANESMGYRRRCLPRYRLLSGQLVCLGGFDLIVAAHQPELPTAAVAFREQGTAATFATSSTPISPERSSDCRSNGGATPAHGVIWLGREVLTVCHSGMPKKSRR